MLAIAICVMPAIMNRAHIDSFTWSVYMIGDSKCHVCYDSALNSEPNQNPIFGCIPRINELLPRVRSTAVWGVGQVLRMLIYTFYTCAYLTDGCQKEGPHIGIFQAFRT